MKHLQTEMRVQLKEMDVYSIVETVEHSIGTRLDLHPFLTEVHLRNGSRVYNDSGSSPYLMHQKAVSYMEKQGFRKLGPHKMVSSGVPTEEVWNRSRREFALKRQGRTVPAWISGY